MGYQKTMIGAEEMGLLGSVHTESRSVVFNEVQIQTHYSQFRCRDLRH